MRRYAIYYAPEPGPLADFLNAWLGWDAARGARVAHPDLPLPVAELTAIPRKYGIHATLKAPFRLTGNPADLDRTLRSLAADLAPVRLDALDLKPLAGFLALQPQGDLSVLNSLAAQVVMQTDPLRAPLSEAEYARRKPDTLTAYQREMLDRWGYPHVMEEFHFHITLTGPLGEEDLARTRAVLTPVLDPLLPRPFEIRNLCLFGEAEDGSFHLVRRYPLGSARKDDPTR